MIALIDGDILVYECGFSSDATAKKNGDEHEPLSYALQNVKQKLKDVLDAAKTTEYEMYLTGKNNYRFEFLPDYKGNRDSTHRPFWYKEIKQYLIDECGAIVCDGEEADDLLGIRQMDPRTETIICTKDKDLDCVPGLHYNWSPSRWEDGIYDISEVEALRFFYTQILTGDSTDNIPGLKKSVGKIATAKIKKGLESLESARDMYDYVASVYGDFDFHPIAKCLWIRQKYGEIWEPPKPTHVTISMDEYEQLLYSEKFFIALQAAGVDNWEGYSEATKEIYGS